MARVFGVIVFVVFSFTARAGFSQNLVMNTALSRLDAASPTTATCVVTSLQAYSWAALTVTLTIQINGTNSVDASLTQTRAGGALSANTSYNFAFDAKGLLGAFSARKNFAGSRVTCSVTATDNTGRRLAETSYVDNEAVIQDGDYCYTDANGINCWIQKRPAIAQALIWEKIDADGHDMPVEWRRWSTAMMEQLRINIANFAYLITYNSGSEIVTIADPPANQAALADADFPLTVLSANDAANLYTKLAGMSLAVEKSGFVPWSLSGYSANALAVLFDSRVFLRTTTFLRVTDSAGRPVASGYVAVHPSFPASTSAVLPAAPLKVIKFLQDKKLIGSSRADTVGRVLNWTMVLRHTSGEQTALYMSQLWQYRGTPPASRMIDGTIDRSAASGYHVNPHHYTGGCWHTTAFLSAVLRVLNIPVEGIVVRDSSALMHSAPHFVADNLYLSHADDPYTLASWGGFTGLPRPPASALLINQATFTSWFSDPTVASPHLGQGVVEALINYPSGEMLSGYQTDVNTGVTNHAQSNVLADLRLSLFPNVYTVAALEARGLWTRIANIVQANGGFTQVNAKLATQAHFCGDQVDQICNEPPPP